MNKYEFDINTRIYKTEGRISTHVTLRKRRPGRLLNIIISTENVDEYYNKNQLTAVDPKLSDRITKKSQELSGLENSGGDSDLYDKIPKELGILECRLRGISVDTRITQPEDYSQTSYRLFLESVFKLRFRPTYAQLENRFVAYFKDGITEKVINEKQHLLFHINNVNSGIEKALMPYFGNISTNDDSGMKRILKSYYNNLNMINPKIKKALMPYFSYNVKK